MKTVSQSNRWQGKQWSAGLNGKRNIVSWSDTKSDSGFKDKSESDEMMTGSQLKVARLKENGVTSNGQDKKVKGTQVNIVSQIKL